MSNSKTSAQTVLRSTQSAISGFLKKQGFCIVGRSAAILLVALICPFRVGAVTHDDSESMIPEFRFAYKGTGSGTPNLTVSFDAYETNSQTTHLLTEYTETKAVTGTFAAGNLWSSTNSLYVSKGMPLDLPGN